MSQSKLAQHASRFGGHPVETPIETMEKRIASFRKEYPDWTIRIKVEHPYSQKKAAQALKNSPGLGEIAIHRAVLIDGEGKIKAEASVMQSYFSLFDFGKKAVCDAIWYAGIAFGPKMTIDELEWEDDLVHPVEKMRRKLKQKSVERTVSRLKAKPRPEKAKVVRPEFVSPPEEPETERPWYWSLHPEDQEWIKNHGGPSVDQSAFMDTESVHPDIPAALLRIGVGGKVNDGVLTLFESKFAPEGCLVRNYPILKDNGFDPSTLEKEVRDDSDN